MAGNDRRPGGPIEEGEYVRVNDFTDWLQMLICAAVFAWYCCQKSERQ